METDPRAPATVIFNPTAGAGRARRRWGAIESAFGDWPTPPQVVRTEGPGHATELAAVASRSGAPLVVAAGGDGTAHETVQGLLAGGTAARGPVFGYLPIGTGCDFATGLGLTAGSAAMARSMPEGRDLEIDVGIAEMSSGGREVRRYFLNAANVGLGPAVAEQVNSRAWLRRSGGPAYLLAAAAALVTARPTRIAWRTDDGREGEEPILNLSVCNGPSFGGG